MKLVIKTVIISASWEPRLSMLPWYGIHHCRARLINWNRSRGKLHVGQEGSMGSRVWLHYLGNLGGPPWQTAVVTRLTLFYKILHDLIVVPSDKVDIQRAARPARHPRNQDNLQRPRASYKASLLWISIVFRTIPQWNSLPTAIAEVDSLSSFKSRLTEYQQ